MPHRWNNLYRVSSFSDIFSTWFSEFMFLISNSNIASLGCPDNGENIAGPCFFNYPK